MTAEEDMIAAHSNLRIVTTVYKKDQQICQFEGNLQKYYDKIMKTTHKTRACNKHKQRPEARLSGDSHKQTHEMGGGRSGECNMEQAQVDPTENEKLDGLALACTCPRKHESRENSKHRGI